MMLGDTRKDQAATDASLAYLLLRATIGANILIHGVTRILNGPGQFASALAQGFHSTPLPPSLVVGFAMALPWIEAAIGIFVLLGLFSRVALSAGALLILVLTFGSTLHQDWEVAGLQLIYAAIYAGLLAFRRYDAYSLDWLLNRSSIKGDSL
jgi:thiosulfate dehydrogenase [quinone] large subunit